MFAFYIEKHVPRFILNDRNGYAVAKAIEAAMQYMNDICSEAVACMSVPESMPEWRLDELAWEYGIPYNYSAPVEKKRRWISAAWELSRQYGTKAGVENFLKAIYDDAIVLERRDYPGGQSSHFRLKIDGAITADNLRMAMGGLENVKNVRSTLDMATFEKSRTKKLYAGSGFFADEQASFTIGKGNALDLDYYMDENGDILLDENRFPLLVEE